MHSSKYCVYSVDFLSGFTDWISMWQIHLQGTIRGPNFTMATLTLVPRNSSMLQFVRIGYAKLK